MRLSDDKQQLVSFIAIHVLYEYTSHELQELIDAMPEDRIDAATVFCEAMELGDWFFSAMAVNNIDINEVLRETAEARRVEEQEAAVEDTKIGRDYQHAQGWPVL